MYCDAAWDQTPQIFQEDANHIERPEAAHHIGEPILCRLMLASRNIATGGKMANGLRLILLKGAFEA